VPPARYRQAGDREKLEALVALKAGDSVHAIAKRMAVAPSTVRRWRDQAKAVGETFPPPSAPDGSPGDPQKSTAGPGHPLALAPEEVDAHLQRYVAEALEALHVQNTLFADREWLQEQSVANVAVAHGVLFDKLARLFAGARGTPLAPAAALPDGGDGRARP
jgi:transposase-like protein